MRIEHLKPGDLNKVTIKKLVEIKNRFNQVYNKNFLGNNVTKARGVDRKNLLKRYKILIKEMRARALKSNKITELDLECFRRGMYGGVEVGELPVIMDTPGYISIHGKFAQDPKDTDTMDVCIKEHRHNLKPKIEKVVKDLLMDMVDIKQVKCQYIPAGPSTEYIPAYDLVLRPRKITKREKPVGLTGEPVALETWSPSEYAVYITLMDKLKPGTVLEINAPGKGMTEVLEKIGRFSGGSVRGTHTQIFSQKGKKWDNVVRWVEMGEIETVNVEVGFGKMLADAVLASDGNVMVVMQGCEVSKARKGKVLDYIEKLGWEMEEVGGARGCLIFSRLEASTGEKGKADKGKGLAGPGKESIQKPETTDKYQRVPVPGVDCKITATITVSEKEGIKGLYCGGERKIATYIFDKEKWTLEEAKAWVKEHTKKLKKATDKAMGFWPGDKGKGVLQLYLAGLDYDEVKKSKDVGARLLVARTDIGKLKKAIRDIYDDKKMSAFVRFSRQDDDYNHGAEIAGINDVDDLDGFKGEPDKIEFPLTWTDKAKNDTGVFEAGDKSLDIFKFKDPDGKQGYGIILRLDKFDYKVFSSGDFKKTLHIKNSRYLPEALEIFWSHETDGWLGKSMEKEELNKQVKVNAPMIAYKAVYGKLPAEPIPGQSGTPRKEWNGLQVDAHIKDKWLDKINNIKGIEIRSTEEGKSDERVAHVIFRFKNKIHDTAAQGIANSIGQNPDYYTLVDEGTEGRPRIVVAGQVQYGKAGWSAWWDDIGNVIERAMSIEKAELHILKKVKRQQLVGGIVYEPDVKDSHGDFMTKSEIQKAMYRFMEKYSNNTARIKVQHQGKGYKFPIIECFQPESDMIRGGKTVKAGSWWLMVKITSKKIWDLVEKGKLTGFSMGGWARMV